MVEMLKSGDTDDRCQFVCLAAVRQVERLLQQPSCPKSAPIRGNAVHGQHIPKASGDGDHCFHH